MKRLLLLLLTFPLFTGCEYFEEWFGKESEPEPEVVPQGIYISVMPDACSYDEAVARLVVMDSTASLIETVDPSAPDVVTIHFWSAEDNLPVMVSAVGEQVFFAKYNPCHEEALPERMLAAYREGYDIVLRECRYDAASKTLHPEGQAVVIPVQVLETDRVRSHTSDDFDTNIRKTVYNFLNDLDAGIGKLDDTMGNLPSGDAADAVCTVWSKFAIPIAKMQLYSDDPEMLAQIQDEYTSGEIQGWMDSMVEQVKDFIIPDNLKKYVAMAEKAWMAFMYGYDNYNPTYSDEQVEEYMSAEELSVFNRRSTYASMQASSMRSEIGIPYDKYLVSAYVRGVDKTSAHLSGGFDCADGQQSYISEMGFYFWSKYEAEKQVTVADLYAGTTLRDLQPGTQYYVVAYVRSLGEEFYSTPVSFITDFDFALSPNELSFDSAGGTKGVAVLIPDSGAEWKIVRTPDWSRIERGETTFFVTVDATSVTRSGEIVVVCTTDSGMTYEAVVAVSQHVSGWNHTRWSVSGSVSVAGESSSSTFELAIGDLSKGEISFGGSAPEGFATSASLNSNGDLIYKMSQQVHQDGATTTVEVSMCFVRVDYSNLTWSMDFTVTASASFMGELFTETITGNGSGTGVLLDASRSAHLIPQNSPWLLLDQFLK